MSESGEDYAIPLCESVVRVDRWGVPLDFKDSPEKSLIIEINLSR